MQKSRMTTTRRADKQRKEMFGEESYHNKGKGKKKGKKKTSYHNKGK